MVEFIIRRLAWAVVLLFAITLVCFALFFLAEFMGVVTMSAIIVTLFLGGPAGPTPFGPDWAWGPLWLLAKVLVFLVFFVSLRATLPRFRYDQLMDLGWKVLIPLALGWLLVLASLNIAHRNTDAAGQLEDIRNLISAGVDAIVVNPADPAGIQAVRPG